MGPVLRGIAVKRLSAGLYNPRKVLARKERDHSGRPRFRLHIHVLPPLGLRRFDLSTRSETILLSFESEPEIEWWDVET